MSRLLVGQPHLQGKLASYADRFDIVEVRPVDTSLPKASKLAAWREQVPTTFAFSVVLPTAVATLGDDGGALHVALETARVLQANAIVLSTPASVRPTKKNRERIAELASRLPADAHALVWHAAGMWEPADVMATAAAAGLVPVFDAAQEALPPGPLVYTRIRALGHAAQLGAERLDLIAHQLAGRREAMVIVEGDQARRVRVELRAALERLDDHRGVPGVFKPSTLAGGDEE